MIDYKIKLVSDIKCLFKEEKKPQYGREHYRNLWEDQKQKLIKYRKNVIEWVKTFYYNGKKVFQFGNFHTFIKENWKNVFLLHLYLKSSLSTNKNVKSNERNFWFSGFVSSLQGHKIFLKCGFWGKKFWNIFFRERFWRSNFWKYFDKCIRELPTGMNDIFYLFKLLIC